MPLIPFGEYRPDVSDYMGAATQNIQNVLPRGDGYGPFKDFAAVATALGAACRGAFYALDDDGAIVIFAATTDRIYKMDNSDYTWDDVSQGGIAYTELNATAQWRFAQFGLVVIAVQANEPPQAFTLGSSSEFADLGGSPPQASYIDIVGRFVVLSGLTSNPFRIQWSGLNAITTWTQGVNQSDYQDFADGGIVRGVAGGEYGYVFQDQAIRRMTYAPGSPVVFQIDRISQDKGLFGPYSIIRSGDHVLFYSSQGFQKIAQGGIITPIGREYVDRTFFTDLNSSHFELFMGAADPNSSRVFWAYKSSSGGAQHYDKILAYDITLNRWTPIDMEGEYLVGLSQPGITLESLDALFPSIDDMDISLDDFSLATAPEIAQFNSSHVLGFFRGANLEATLESSEQAGEGRRMRVKGFRPVVDADSYYGSCSKRELLNATPTYSDEIVVNSRTGRIDLNHSTRFTRMNLRIPAGASWTFAAGIEPDIAAEGAF
jgi:hypothetical protein